MSLVSVEEAEATRRSWREDVQFNIARMDEALKIAKEIGGEHLSYDLARLHSLADRASYSHGEAYNRNRRYYCKELRRMAEQHKGSLPALRKLDKAIRELPPKPEYLTGIRDAGHEFKFENIDLMRAVFAAEMGLRMLHRRVSGWAGKLRETSEASRYLEDWPDQSFILGDHRGAIRADIWEPYDHVESWDHGPLKALARDLGLECVILPATMGMWHPGRTVPVVFYQSESNHRPAIEAAIDRMVQELGPQ
jgi:hypothetical protein